MKTLAPEAENQLVNRLQAREEQAMAFFYRNYQAALFQTILRIVQHRELAEDVLQESMLKFWQGFASYDRSKGRLFTWALRIGRNLAIDRLRAARAQRAAAPSAPFSEQTVGGLAAPAGFKPEHLDVRDWLQLLNASDRRLLEMLYFEGYTYPEAAQHLHLPEGTVKTRGRRIMRTLAQRLRLSKP